MQGRLALAREAPGAAGIDPLDALRLARSRNVGAATYARLTARYGGPGLDDRGRALRLLGELGATPDEARAARFRCAIALADPERVHFTVSGAVEGRIARAPAGESGFGYDPVFKPEGFDRTFAELGAEVKQRISHRARALRLFRERIERDGLPM